MACEIDTGFLRSLAIVLQKRIATLKTTADDLYDMTKEWILDQQDLYLPPPENVKTALEEYESIRIEAISLAESIRKIKECDVFLPDTITIPQSGLIIPSDGTFTF